MFDSLAFGGAKIEDITKKVEELRYNECHIVYYGYNLGLQVEDRK